jgi:hypothetical protein
VKRSMLALRTGWPSALGVVLLCGSCGRSTLDIPPPISPRPECIVDQDCPTYGDFCNPVTCVYPEVAEGEEPPRRGVCQDLEAVTCDDGDPCSLDMCEPATGECFYEPAAVDIDGDGFKGPREGTVAGEPGSCGDDCDDTSPDAFPGGEETCDGVDNDCNGVVDDNATFVPVADEPVRISGEIAPAGPGGIAFSGQHYATTYWGNADGFDLYRQLLLPSGETFAAEAPVSLVNADSSGGPIVWTGDRFGLAWQDRRDNDYEVYFTLFDPLGNKILPDTRLTVAPDFSVNVAMEWTGSKFAVVWQDRREQVFNVYGQIVSLDGVPQGGNVALGEIDGFGNESPQIAAGVTTLGVAWNTGNTTSHFIELTLFDHDLNKTVGPIQLTDGLTDSVYPVVAWNVDSYVVAWYDRTASPKAIYAAVVDETGQILVPATAITQPGAFRSRYPQIKPLGDRVLVIYSDDRDQNDGYELYSRMVTTELEPLSPELRLTNAPRDSIYPIAAFGPEGDVGVLFRDDRQDGDHHIFFSRMRCQAVAE